MSYNPDLYQHIIKVSPKYAVSYYRNKFPSNYQRFIPDKRRKGDKFAMSKQARKSMSNCFAWLRIISNPKEVYSKNENKKFWFELSFITLTMPSVQIHSDDYIKTHLLQPFLKWMQRSWSCNSYIWKAEVQNNGNIHFHITTNKFIHWKSIRAKWNRLCAAHGYCKVYQDGSNDKGDAATSVKAVINADDINNYIGSYCSKKDAYKKEFNEHRGKYEFIHDDVTEMPNHYYREENHREIECEDGTFRAYKRRIHGRLWNASYNLNIEAPWIDQSYDCYNEMIKFIDNPAVCKTLDCDYAKVHLYKDKVFNKLPDDMKSAYKVARKELRKQDVIQTKLEIETIY